MSAPAALCWGKCHPRVPATQSTQGDAHKSPVLQRPSAQGGVSLRELLAGDGKQPPCCCISRMPGQQGRVLPTVSPVPVPSARVRRAPQPCRRFRLLWCAPSIMSHCLILIHSAGPAADTAPSWPREMRQTSHCPQPISLHHPQGHREPMCCLLLPATHCNPSPGADGVCTGQGGMAEPEAQLQTSQSVVW